MKNYKNVPLIPIKAVSDYNKHQLAIPIRSLLTLIETNTGTDITRDQIKSHSRCLSNAVHDNKVSTRLPFASINAFELLSGNNPDSSRIVGEHFRSRQVLCEYIIQLIIDNPDECYWLRSSTLERIFRYANNVVITTNVENNTLKKYQQLHGDWKDQYWQVGIKELAFVPMHEISQWKVHLAKRLEPAKMFPLDIVDACLKKINVYTFVL
jgi:hypothetical protein